MAKKIINKGKTPAKVVTKKAAPAVIAKTEVRNSPIPKIAAAAPTPVAAPKLAITSDMIAKRAYEIWAGGTGGSEAENWARAERELRAGM